jgi:hypothetical protein
MVSLTLSRWFSRMRNSHETFSVSADPCRQQSAIQMNRLSERLRDNAILAAMIAGFSSA